MTPPSFPYHPDPVATGSVVTSDSVCSCCGQARGFVYTGPVYAVDDVEALCPWCIADGSAAARFEATFTDAFAPDGVDPSVVDEICLRTPGFSGWQQEEWLFHCGDGAAFLGRAGFAGLDADALAAVRRELAPWPADQIDHYLAALSLDEPPTAYLFRCRVCGTQLAYTDST